ncbi:MAG: MFS transporter [Clostridia bacterium]|nr:MFS transporter [Clostridia bacterium]
MESKKYAFSRLLYIIEAALEYFVSIAVGTVYLAKITASIGMSDALTGILTAFVSLGCGFQVIALFISHKTPVRGWVTISHIISQSLFGLMYFVPLLNASQAVKFTLLILCLFLAQIIHNAISAPKINWYMSLVDDRKRGSFTANKEIVSLISGMIFTYALGYVMDTYATKKAFIICGVMIFVLMALHTLTLVFAKEKPVAKKDKVNVKASIKALFGNKALVKVIGLFVIWNIASSATMSFSGAYQNGTLGFTTTFSSIIIIVASIARAIFSRPLGKYADKHSFCKMLYICFILEMLAFGISVFIVPENGKIMYLIFYSIYAIGQAGINSSIINLAYDYVPNEQKTGAVALVNTCYGLTGFITTLLVSPIVDYIQKNDNMLFGYKIYSQQLMSTISMVFVGIILLYLSLVIAKIPPKPKAKLFIRQK